MSQISCNNIFILVTISCVHDIHDEHVDWYALLPSLQLNLGYCEGVQWV